MRLIDKAWGDWDSIRSAFRWNVPEYFNIAQAVCDRHAAGGATALLYEDEDGHQEQYTFGQLQQQANRLANALADLGVQRGDRVAIILPQRPETGIAHLAIYKLGAIALPLAALFGPEALRYRLSDSAAKAVIVGAEDVHKVREIRSDLEALTSVIIVGGGPGADELDLAEALAGASENFETARTKADDPALIIYTSGTTGPPKGALHAHRVLIGHLPGFEMSHGFFPQPGDVAWTAADWAWIGGLMDVLMPTWFYGMPVVAYRARKFDPEKSLALLEKYGVRNTFLPPSALKMLRQVKDIPARFKIDLRTIMSGGEALGAEVLAWAEDQLGVKINEIYGQTEANYVIGNCAEVMPVRPGSMGKPYPGHIAEIIDGEGNVLPAGQEGEIAFDTIVDPVAFLGYWNDPKATDEKYTGKWARSGDLGVKDDDGYFWFRGRSDDVISSAGYRIGPGEIEESLMGHPAVMAAAAVGSPDEVRGTIVKAFIKLAPGTQPSDDLAAELQQQVRQRLAAHEYPRQIEFVNELPTTTTGKIKRRELRLLEERRNRGPTTVKPWSEGYKIPWDEPGFSDRMLLEHLTQDHDAASRRTGTIRRHADAIQALLRPGGRVLDLGCGPGLYCHELARRGYQCVGVDFSPASIRWASRTAQASQLSSQFLSMDIREIEFEDEFDLVMLIYGEFNVFTRQDARSILHRARKALKAKGQLLLEPHRYEAVEGNLVGPPTWRSQESGLFSDRPHILLEEGFWDEAQQTATKRYQVIDSAGGPVAVYAQSVVAYRPDELAEMLIDAGFSTPNPVEGWDDDGEVYAIVTHNREDTVRTGE